MTSRSERPSSRVGSQDAHQGPRQRHEQGQLQHWLNQADDHPRRGAQRLEHGPPCGTRKRTVAPWTASPVAAGQRLHELRGAGRRVDGQCDRVARDGSA
jgi:hypothetical protein